MSSYLTIYGVPKNEGKPIDIVSFSRSHCIYSAICDEVNVAWAGESEVYTNLNTSDLDGVIHSIEEDIKSSAERLTLYEKYADVMIMCEQLSNYFGKEKVALERERKLTRLEERLSKYEQV